MLLYTTFSRMRYIQYADFNLYSFDSIYFEMRCDEGHPKIKPDNDSHSSSKQIKKECVNFQSFMNGNEIWMMKKVWIA